MDRIHTCIIAFALCSAVDRPQVFWPGIPEDQEQATGVLVGWTRLAVLSVATYLA